MRIEKCYFCSGPIYPGHGMVFVRNDSKLFRFCRPKCHKHFKAKHNPRKIKWTKAYRKAHGKEMVKDTTFEFEKKRNEPVRYNRDLYVKTVQAMKKISKIKQRREELFYDARMKAAKGKKKEDVVRDLEKHVDLISEPKVKNKIQTKKLEKEAQKKAISDKLRNRNKKKIEEEEIDDEFEDVDNEGEGMMVE